MNVENFKQLRTFVEQNEKFTMRTYIHDCGTAACIIGSAVVLGGFSRELACGGVWAFDDFSVMEWLDVNLAEYDHIRYGGWSKANWKFLTKEEALTYLDKVIEAGNVFSRID